jgi:hypothetical protein
MEFESGRFNPKQVQDYSVSKLIHPFVSCDRMHSCFNHQVPRLILGNALCFESAFSCADAYTLRNIERGIKFGSSIKSMAGLKYDGGVHSA